jgi:parvulin-like peptidyl-prolyl isomerase
MQNIVNGQEVATRIYPEEIALKKAEELYQRIMQGEDFTSLAKQYSIDRVSALKGGDLGPAKPGVMVPEFEKAVLGLQPSEISKPVRSEYGYHLIQLVNKDKEQFHAKHILIGVR